ncbi:uncharacterized protein LAJ45_00833 [Morchella importuna]|uniref:uncharacterized protein n=1 Tax=Morchella importuna TaxID=1174673 RepID=UPI001E8DBDCA|nr:uncharacterized protein LAJ45_00833 [Morchella importuna]KAH8155821.1 hypothetical protein LAJ45_00833 [Morchella importuna]
MPPMNARTLTMPMAAATMAILLFVYTRTSINAAKTNAKMQREADGGQISWRNQSLRQHGQLPDEPLPEQSGVARVIDRVSTGRGAGGERAMVEGSEIASIEFQNLDTKVIKTKGEAPHSSKGPPPINYRNL